MMDLTNSLHGAKNLVLNWYFLTGVWVLLWALLLKVSSVYFVIPVIGTGVLATLCTEGIYTALSNFMPRRTIKDTAHKVVFITGCDSGFGLELSISLHKLGFKVFSGCLFPNGEGALALQRATMQAPERLRIIKLDVTSEEDVNNAFTQVKDGLLSNERLWAVVNNAGIASITEIEWCPLEVYRQVLDVNSLGPIRVTKAFLPLLRKNSESRVVIVASLAGRFTFPGFSAYSMSKHASVSFADALRLEMAKWNVTVHTIEPTLYRTKIADVKQSTNSIDKLWHQCSDDIQDSYGEDYLEEFKNNITEHLNRARPSELICEVVDDMVDAVAGESPKTRYVPSFTIQLREKLLLSMPNGVRDSLFLKGQPKTPPADVQKRRRLPPYKYPVRKNAKRTISEPTREKFDLSPLVTSASKTETIFKFPDPILSITEIDEDNYTVSEKEETTIENNNSINNRMIQEEDIMVQKKMSSFHCNDHFTDLAAGQRMVELR